MTIDERISLEHVFEEHSLELNHSEHHKEKSFYHLKMCSGFEIQIVLFESYKPGLFKMHIYQTEFGDRLRICAPFYHQTLHTKEDGISSPYPVRKYVEAYELKMVNQLIKYLSKVISD